MFTPMQTWLAVFCGVIVLIVFAAITGYLEGTGRRVLPRPDRPRLPRPRRRRPKVTVTVWGHTPQRRALPVVARRAAPTPAVAPLALPAAAPSDPATTQIITGEIVR